MLSYIILKKFLYYLRVGGICMSIYLCNYKFLRCGFVHSARFAGPNESKKLVCGQRIEAHNPVYEIFAEMHKNVRAQN